MRGMDMSDALTELELLGATVEDVKGTGEIIVKHPAIPRWMRVNYRRKDAPRCLTHAIRKLSKERAS